MTERKLGRGVAVVGAGMSRFGAFPGATSRDLFVEAAREMRASADRGLDPRDIEAGYNKDNPYCTGIVRLAEGPAISAQILGVDPRQPAQAVVGAPVRVAFLERSEGDRRRTYLAFETQ